MNLNLRDEINCYRIRVPETLKFSDLSLHQNTDGSFSYDTVALKTVCQCSGFPFESVIADDELVWELIQQWYFYSLANQGAPDPLMDLLMFEATFPDFFD